MKILGFCLALISLTTSCSNDKMPKFTILQGLRVMDLVIDQPEINFNGAAFSPTSVQVTPWISDLYGAGRSLSYNLYWCLDPGVGVGITPNCTGSSTLTTVATAQTVATTANFLSPNYTGSMTPITVSLTGLASSVQTALAAAFSLETSAQLYNGYSLLIFFEIYPTSAVSQKVTTFKRLVFSSSVKTSKNQNPTGLQIQSAGTEITALPTAITSLTAYMPSSSSESFSQINSDGSTTTSNEKLTNTWYLTGPQDIECSKKKECTTDGTLLLYLTNISELNTFTPPSVATPTTRGRVLVAVGKDNRGGAVVKRYCDGLCP